MCAGLRVGSFPTFIRALLIKFAKAISFLGGVTSGKEMLGAPQWPRKWAYVPNLRELAVKYDALLIVDR